MLNNTFENQRIGGMYFRDFSANLIITGNEIHTNNGAFYDGISTFFLPGNHTISDNLIYPTSGSISNGIRMNVSTGGHTITGNRIYSAQTGLQLSNQNTAGDRGLIANNTFEASDYALQLAFDNHFYDILNNT